MDENATICLGQPQVFDSGHCRMRTSMQPLRNEELRLKFLGRPVYFQSSRRNPVFFMSSTKLLS